MTTSQCCNCPPATTNAKDDPLGQNTGAAVSAIQDGTIIIRKLPARKRPLRLRMRLMDFAMFLMQLNDSTAVEHLLEGEPIEPCFSDLTVDRLCAHRYRLYLKPPAGFNPSKPRKALNFTRDEIERFLRGVAGPVFTSYIHHRPDLGETLAVWTDADRTSVTYRVLELAHTK